MSLLNRLQEEFDPSEVKWRVQKTNKDCTRALVLAYVDARTVMNRLDDVIGSLAWRDEYTFMNDGVHCRLSVWDGTKEIWVFKEDGAPFSNYEAMKGGISDSFKRAAVKFGIARYLYDMDAPWVDLTKERQKSNDVYAKVDGKTRYFSPPDISPESESTPPESVEESSTGSVGSLSEGEVHEKLVDDLMESSKLHGYLGKVTKMAEQLTGLSRDEYDNDKKLFMNLTVDQIHNATDWLNERVQTGDDNSPLGG